jgi:hypothetical protein
VKFYGEPHGEASGYSGGESWHVEFDGRGMVDVEDGPIADALLTATEHPDSPIATSEKEAKAKAKARAEAAAPPVTEEVEAGA